MSALLAAMAGDDAFFEAIQDADPDVYGISCECGLYYTGNFNFVDPSNACCPSCGSSVGSFESPALGGGPSAKNRLHRNLLIAAVALLNKLHGYPMPGMRTEYINAMRAVIDAGAVAEGPDLVIKEKNHV